MDRFLEENIKDASELRKSAVSLKQSMKELKENIDKFRFYENAIDLRNILNLTSQFLAKQLSPNNLKVSSSFISSSEPCSLGLNDHTPEQINNCITILNSYKELSNTSIQTMENKMEEYKVL